MIRAPLRLVPKGAILPILQGRLRGYRWVAGSSNHGCWLGSYEHDKQQLFEETITAGAVVYDIGANVGFYTLLAFELIGPKGKVIAFEPLPRNLRYLRQHLTLNKLSNVQVINAAVSDKSGEARFDDTREVTMGQLTPEGKLVVRVVSLDQLISTGTIPPPQFMKIDVEGAEEAVLIGASAILERSHPTIFLATHGDDVRAHCLARLQEAGYAIEPIGAATAETADEFIARPL
jgi:FkbM family methyltransferase